MGKRLGQHFLRNVATAKKIVASLEIKSGDTIIEVGPGHGELTNELKVNSEQLKVKIVAIEKDRELAQELRERFAKNPEIEIVEADARAILPKLLAQTNFQIPTSNFKLAGNIPYYITGNLLHTLSELKHPPARTVLMVQKEVAERIVAQPPHMNRLAAVSQCWADVKIAGIVSRGEFDPPPEVDSAIVVLKTRPELPVPKGTCFQMAKILFAQPRKMILNNLLARSALGTTTKEEILKILGRLGIDPRARPQNLGVEAIANLARELF